jgi:hypothetical protein
VSDKFWQLFRGNDGFFRASVPRSKSAAEGRNSRQKIRFLGGEHRPQIEKYQIIFDPGNHRRIVASQSHFDFVRPEVGV